MEQRIRNYVNEIFKNAPKTPQAEEVKNEILGNTLEKYNELKAEGKDDETALLRKTINKFVPQNYIK